MLGVFALALDLGDGEFRRAEIVRRVLYVVEHRDFIFIEAQLVVLIDELAVFADDLEAIGARGFAGGGDEYAGRAVRIFEICGHIVLDLDIVPLAKAAMRVDAARHHAGDPLEQVDLMRGLIVEHAAALALPCRAPAAAVEVIL